MGLNFASLAVGHGDCSVIYDDERSHVVVIDCADGPSLVSFLDRERISAVRLAIITHNDSDHIRGLTHLIRSKEVRCVALHSNINDNTGVPKRILRDLVETIEQHNSHRSDKIDIACVSTSDTKLIEHTAQLPYSVQLLYPSPIDTLASKSSNATSGVVRVEGFGVVGLFTGDMDMWAWRRIIDASADVSTLKADVLKFPHHGGALISPRDRIDEQQSTAESCTREMLSIISPTITVISTGDRGGWQHPNPDVLRTLLEYGNTSNHRICCTGVTKLCDNNPGSKRSDVLRMLPVANHPHANTSCPCAGNVFAKISNEGSLEILPDLSCHGKIINQFSSSRCRTMTASKN